MENYAFIGKALFFPEKGILVIGDLHLGYEHQLIESGILAPQTQIKDLIFELKGLIEKTKPKKIIFLGDIQHSFKFELEEKYNFREVVEFLKKHFKEEDIIFIKGNHDTIDYSFANKIKDYYIEGDIAFLHGHKTFLELFDKKIKTIVMGHIHPSMTLADPETTKKERYKCFLIGKFNKKEVIILPSFSDISIGSPINEYLKEYDESFSIIPKKNLLKASVYAIGKDKVYEFGKVKSL